jgi:spore coat protein CotF
MHKRSTGSWLISNWCKHYKQCNQNVRCINTQSTLSAFFSSSESTTNSAAETDLIDPSNHIFSMDSPLVNSQESLLSCSKEHTTSPNLSPDSQDVFAGEKSLREQPLQ